MSERSDGQFDYEDWVQNALHGVLRRALETLAASQAPGEHHVYVNFRIAYAKGAALMPPTLMLYCYKGLHFMLHRNFIKKNYVT